LFMILYGFFRVVSEQFREPDPQIGYLFDLFSMGSFLSFFMIIMGLFLLKKARNNEFAQ
jgi:phosphatidylglycerol:prolipoprotein diacylglycerol transferase